MSNEPVVERVLNRVERVEHAATTHETGIAVVAGESDSDERLSSPGFAGYSGEVVECGCENSAAHHGVAAGC